jgi:hypothetical protein
MLPAPLRGPSRNSQRYEVNATLTEYDRNQLALQLSTEIPTARERLQPDTPLAEARLIDPIQRLAAIEQLAPTGKPVSIRQPITPLRDTVLMTNARDQPALGREIEAEIESADRIDIVLAFIRWTGIRSLLPHLHRHAERNRGLRVLPPTRTERDSHLEMLHKGPGECLSRESPVEFTSNSLAYA